MLRPTALISASLILLSCGGNQSGKTPATVDSTPAVVAQGPAPASAAPESTGPDGVAIESGKLPKSAAALIPPGYAVLDTSTGDLNLDAYPDMVLVLKKPGEETAQDDIDNPTKRPLLIMTGTADGAYTLAGRNDNTVYCYSCGGMMGDPYTGITIKNGYFSVEHYGGSAWRWTHIVTYKYSPAEKNWLLHKDGRESFHASDPEKADSKVRTTKDFGKVPFERFDIYAEDEAPE